MSRYALFNADGTLLDTMPKHRSLAINCITKYLHLTEREASHLYDTTVGLPFPQQLDKGMGGRNPSERVQCFQEYARRKLMEVYGSVQAFPEVPVLMRRFRDDGLSMSVSTSTESDTIANALLRSGVRGNFEYIWGSDTGSKRDHIHRILDAKHPDQLYYVGDTPHDMALCSDGVVTIGRIGMFTEQQLRDAGATKVVKEFDLSLFD